MSTALVAELYGQIDALPIIDIHTHVDWKRPSARHIGDLLSYHYYTELIHSAEWQPGEAPTERFPYHDPQALARTILSKLHLIDNTVQYDWWTTILREFLGLGPAEWAPENWQDLFERSARVMGHPDWPKEVVARSQIERVFMTNEYDEDLTGLDEGLYVPCLRTEPFVVNLDRAEVRERMARFLGRPIRGPKDVCEALAKAFTRFMEHGMGYAALSAPANLRTFAVPEEEAERLLRRLCEQGSWDAEERATWAAWAIARVCDACRVHGKPFHLMIGVERGAYAHGVPSGMDLFDSVNSLSGYGYLWNAYPDVRFPVSVLADTTGLELVASAWVRHNVYPSGHWWYANQPTDIARELRRRLDVVPRNKVLGYYSDAYYLEFILPKFRMYKFELASVLAERIERSLIHPNMEVWTLDDTLDLAKEILIDNPMRILGIPGG
ncbi:MAG: hypothetical protein H5T69_05735 [Chloroflexi bacterium]|nr:hypothetical protein [Chloroflexota bacterium]